MTSTKQSLSDLFVYRPLTAAERRDFDELGFIKYGPILTSKGLELMRSQTMDAWIAEKGEFDPTKTWLQNALLVNIHHKTKAVRDYYFRGPLVDVAEQLIGPNIKGATSQLTFKMRGNTKPFGWHQDNGYGELDPYNALTCLTALDDATVENGCLWLIPGSHRQGQIDVRSLMTPEQKKAGTEITLTVNETDMIPAPLK